MLGLSWLTAKVAPCCTSAHRRDGYSYEDAAAQTQLPIGTLKSRLSRGRSRLRDMLEGSSSGTGRGGQQRDVRVAVRA